MGLKSRIRPQSKPAPAAIVKPPPIPLKVRKEFHPVLNLRACAHPKGQAPKGWKCTASWEVIPSDDQILEFLLLEEKLGRAKRLYHGTKTRVIHLIAKEGLRPGKDGMFGSGIYLGEPNKCIGYVGVPSFSYAINTPGNYATPVCYMFEVDALLGKIKTCDGAEKYSLRRLQEEGFDSVHGSAFRTLSWNGTLRHDEYVIYDPFQVLVRYIHEYQQVAPQHQPVEISGTCGLMVAKEVALTAKNRAFKDVVSKQPCGRLSYTSVQTLIPSGKSISGTQRGSHHTLWLCADCIHKYKLRKGSLVEIKHARVYRPSVMVRIL